VHLLGGKKCVWGPGYWCQSVAHAKACGVSNFLFTVMNYSNLIMVVSEASKLKDVSVAITENDELRCG
jgi:hypothetical protein